MKTQRQTTLCPEGWYYLLVVLLVFSGAMLREVNLLLMLAGMLAGPLIFNWRTVGLTLRGLTVTRKVPQGVCAGDLLVAHVMVENTRRKIGAWAVVVEEQLQPLPAPGQPDRRGEKPVRTGVFFPHVPARQSRKAVYRGRLPRLGRYQLGPLRVSTRFPFGLFCRTLTTSGTDTLTVYPRLGRLTRRWATRRREAFAGTHRRERRHGPEGDFYGVRPWRSGDPLRWVHWRTSARIGELAVRQFERPRNRDVAVLLDLWQPLNPGPEHLENVELAVSFAATVLSDLCRTGGSNLHLAIAEPDPEHTGGPASAALLHEMMERLAVTQAQSDDHLGDLLEDALGRIEPGTEIVLVSTRRVDLSQADRFPALWSDPARRTLLRRIRCIDTSSRLLARYFQPE